MADDKARHGFLSGPEYAYLATLALFFSASFFPEQRLWGLNVWGFFPIWVRFTLLGAGLLGLAIVQYWTGEQKQHHKEPSKAQSDQLYWLVSCGILVAFGLLFYLLRAKTHFLGDGYTLLSMLADEKPLIKSRGLGEGLAHLWLKSLIGGEAESAALLSYQIISIGAGLAFLATVLLSARALFTDFRDRLLFALGLGSGGYMLLFFGYVENYALFCLSILLFTVIGVLVGRGKLARWLIVLPLGLAFFFHVLGVTLIPSALYLISAGTPIGDRILRMGRTMKWGFAGGLVVFGAAAFAYSYSTDYFFRFAFVPLLTNQFTADGYTLFSGKHLLDYVNLLFLLVPGLLILLAVFISTGVEGLLKRVEFRFLLVLVVCTLGTSFMFDPKLGMPRDWDLFSFPGVPAAAFCLIAITSVKTEGIQVQRATLLFLLCGWLSLGGHVALRLSPEPAIAQMKAFINLDKGKCRTGRAVLIDYFESRGDAASAEALKQEWGTELLGNELLARAKLLVDQGKVAEATPILNQLRVLEPGAFGVWEKVAACFYLTGSYDSALYYLGVADGLNPYNAQMLANLGLIHFKMNAYEEAERYFRLATRSDSALLMGWSGLVEVYRAQGRTADFWRVCLSVAHRDDAPLEYIKSAAEQYLQQGNEAEAATLLRRGLARGLDSQYVQSLSTWYPRLRGRL